MYLSPSEFSRFLDSIPCDNFGGHRPSLLISYKGLGYCLSIQASAYHYCSPRRSGIPLSSYDEVEIAVWEESTGNWVKGKDIRLPSYFHDLWNDYDDVTRVTLFNLRELLNELIANEMSLPSFYIKRS